MPEVIYDSGARAFADRCHDYSDRFIGVVGNRNSLEVKITHYHRALPRRQDRLESRPFWTHHPRTRCRDDGPAPFPRGCRDTFHVIGVLVRDDYSLDGIWRDIGNGQPLLQYARRKTGIHEYSRTPRLQKDRISTAAAAENPQIHQI